MKIRFAIAILCISTSTASTAAQPAEIAPDPPDTATDGAAPTPVGRTAVPAEITLDAYDAVREGNRLLRTGKAQDALRLYEHADHLKPDAREIAFGEGLSRYALGEYEQARESFQGVSLGQADAMADDALYSEGASYHAEALGAMDNPELALSHLENAMQRYQSVLKHRPEHEGAKDANYKAAHAWRQIKQMMQQQEQQQQQDGDKQNDEQEEKDQQQDEQQQQQDENEEQQSSQDQEQQERQSDQSDQEQERDQKQQDEPQQQDAEAEQEESKEQQPQPSQQEQDVSREQAERKLREMMQAQRQRQKNRKKQRALVPVRSTEKDW